MHILNQYIASQHLMKTNKICLNFVPFLVFLWVCSSKKLSRFFFWLLSQVRFGIDTSLCFLLIGKRSLFNYEIQSKLSDLRNVFVKLIFSLFFCSSNPNCCFGNQWQLFSGNRTGMISVG